MTTKVTVDAHAGWPVKVDSLDQNPDGSLALISEATVSPNTQRDFYVWQGRILHVTEMTNENT